MMSQNFYVIYRAFLLGCQNFIRNSWLSVAATAVMVLSISFVLAGVILNSTFKDITAQLSQNLKVSVYLEEGASAAEVEDLWGAFSNHEAVAEVSYINAEEAKEIFTTNNRDNIATIQAVDLVGGDIFPASLEVSVFDLNYIDEIGRLAEDEAYEDVVASHSLGKTKAEETVGNAISIQNAIVRVSVILSLVLGVVAFLIIFNTIRIAIFSRREEIQIMRLVGAPVRFIREPFLIEAGLYGLVGGFLAFGLIYGLIWVFSDQITDVHQWAGSYANFVENKAMVFLMFIGAIGSGIALSTFSCILALQTHLRL